jgi:predicted metal-dependent peptidase
MAGPPDLRINADEGESHRIRIARILVSRDFPYLSAPLYLAVLVETPEVETAQINERLHLLFNPKWTRTLDDRELKGLLLHEIYHWLRGHTGARGQKAYSLVRAELPGVEEGLAWNLVNLAADLEINDDIPHQGSGYALPRGGVLPENLGLEPGGILEAYVKELLKRLEGEAGPDEDGKGIEEVGNNQAGEGNEEGECNEKGEGDEGPPGESEGETGGGTAFREGGEGESAPGGGEGEGGRNGEAEGAEPSGGGLRGRLEAPSFPIDLRPAPEAVARRLEEEGLGLRPGLSEAVRQQVAVEIMRHVASRGDVPANLRRWAKERLHPKVNWRAVLRNSVRQGLVTLRQRRFPSYALRHRRAEALDPFFLPGAYGRLPRVAVVVDTSGSVSDAMLAQALGELRGVLRSGARVTLYSVDAEVHHVQRVFRGDPVVLYGGGGTDMRVGIARALEDGHDLVVVLTDGYTPWPEVPPRARVVVGLLGDFPNGPPSWAKVVRIPLDAE